jgi:hypothetical protein
VSLGTSWRAISSNLPACAVRGAVRWGDGSARADRSGSSVERTWLTNDSTDARARASRGAATARAKPCLRARTRRVTSQARFRSRRSSRDSDRGPRERRCRSRDSSARRDASLTSRKRARREGGRTGKSGRRSNDRRGDRRGEGGLAPDWRRTDTPGGASPAIAPGSERLASRTLSFGRKACPTSSALDTQLEKIANGEKNAGVSEEAKSTAVARGARHRFADARARSARAPHTDSGSPFPSRARSLGNRACPGSARAALYSTPVLIEFVWELIGIFEALPSSKILHTSRSTLFRDWRAFAKKRTEAPRSKLATSIPVCAARSAKSVRRTFQSALPALP